MLFFYRISLFLCVACAACLEFRDVKLARACELRYPKVSKILKDS